MSNGTKWTEADQIKVLKLSLQGLSRGEIIARTGIPGSSVGRFLRVGKPDPRYSQDKVAKDEVEHQRLLVKAKAQLASERGAAVGDTTAGGAEASTSAAPALKGKRKAREVAAPYTRPALSSRPAQPPIASTSRGIVLPPPAFTALPFASSSSNLPPTDTPAPTDAFWPKIIDLISRTLPDFPSSTTPAASSRLATLPASYSTSFGSAPPNDLPEAYSTSFGTQSYVPVDTTTSATASLPNPIPPPPSSLAIPTPSLVPAPSLPLVSSTPAIDDELMKTKSEGK